MGLTRKNLAFLLLCLLALFGGKGFSVEEKSQKVPQNSLRALMKSSELFERISENSALVKDLSADVSFELYLANLGIHFNVTGNIYYKQPDKMRLKLHEIPDFIATREGQAFNTTSLLADLRKNITKTYDARILNKAEVEGRECYLVQLVPKIKKGLSKILLWVDAQNLTMPQVILHYDDGSILIQHKHYIQRENIYLVDKMETDYTASDVTAEITASFSHYQINKGVPDSVFEGENSAHQNAISTF